MCLPAWVRMATAEDALAREARSAVANGERVDDDLDWYENADEDAEGMLEAAEEQAQRLHREGNVAQTQEKEVSAAAVE